MSIKDIIIHKAFREINGFKSIPETNDTYIKLPKQKKKLLKTGVPAYQLGHTK